MNKRSEIPRPWECEADIVDEAAAGRVLRAMPSDRVAKRVADIFDALGDPTRLRILHALAVEPLCVCDLAVVASVSQSAVSHQLRILRDLDLVTFERDGRRAVYRLADAHVETLLGEGREHAEEDARG